MAQEKQKKHEKSQISNALKAMKSKKSSKKSSKKRDKHGEANPKTSLDETKKASKKIALIFVEPKHI